MSAMIPQATIAANLAGISERIAAAAESCGRRAAEVALVAVTKTQPPEAIEAAIAAGLIGDLDAHALAEWVTRVGGALILAPPETDLDTLLETMLLPVLSPAS